MSREIGLTQGKVAVVDDDDFDCLNQYKWQAHNNYGYGWYAVRCSYGPRKRTIFMHRQVLGLRRGKLADHINGNGLDNRRSNLRLCTHSQNSANHQKRKGKSKYNGVCWCKQYQKWRARICVDYKRIHLGRYDTEIEAAAAYDVAAVKHFGEFARLNFPKKGVA